MEDKARMFVEKVCAKTIAGELKWEKTPKTGVFQTGIARLVVLFSLQEKQNVKMYQLELLDENGEVVDSYTDETFERSEVALSPNSLFKRMGTAYERARRQAMGVDRALDAILEELG